MANSEGFFLYFERNVYLVVVRSLVNSITSFPGPKYSSKYSFEPRIECLTKSCKHRYFAPSLKEDYFGLLGEFFSPEGVFPFAQA